MNLEFKIDQLQKAKLMVATVDTTKIKQCKT